MCFMTQGVIPAYLRSTDNYVSYFLPACARGNSLWRWWACLVLSTYEVPHKCNRGVKMLLPFLSTIGRRFLRERGGGVHILYNAANARCFTRVAVSRKIQNTHYTAIYLATETGLVEWPIVQTPMTNREYHISTST